MDDNIETVNEERKVKKTGKNTKKAIIFAIIIIVFAFIILLAFDICNDIYGFSKPYGKAEIDIKKGSNTVVIADVLKDKKIIKYPLVFRLYSKMAKADGKYQFGIFECNTASSYSEIINQLEKKPDLENGVKFTIPEGYTQSQIIETIVSKGVSNEDAFKNTINNGSFDYDFLKGLTKRENALEGYLFPDTYEVFKDEDAGSVIDRLLKNFEKKIKDNNIEELANAQGMTLDDAVILGSMIERETLRKTDLALVSSVFHNRLDKKMKLQSCVTVLYALGTHKDYVSIEDTKVKSPYNTYYIEGLPKGPVCCPGIEAIKAAVSPVDSDYLYFCSKPDGSIIFSKTYSEHLKAIKSNKGSYGTGTVDN